MSDFHPYDDGLAICNECGQNACFEDEELCEECSQVHSEQADEADELMGR